MTTGNGLCSVVVVVFTIVRRIRDTSRAGIWLEAGGVAIFTVKPPAARLMKEYRPPASVVDA
ncbi:MAG: hypothetical protein U5M50_00485 [Sphingobium sp.]|nr:hypothetical protein [Sphingobium sp.]